MLTALLASAGTRSAEARDVPPLQIERAAAALVMQRRSGSPAYRVHPCVQLVHDPWRTFGLDAFEDTQLGFTPADFLAIVKAKGFGMRSDVRARLALLAKAGLLAATPVTDGATAYSMTWKGFAASNDSGCFETVEGPLSARILSWTGKQVAGVDLYQVVASVSPGRPAAWTNDGAFLQAFGRSAIRAQRAKTLKFELAAGRRGYVVMSENGRPVSPNRVDRTLLEVYIRRAGPVDAASLAQALQAAFDGPLSDQTRLCLPLPSGGEADQTDLPPGVRSGSAPLRQSAVHFTYYNLPDATLGERTPALRGYAKMRKLEQLGLATSERLPATGFKQARAKGAVRFTIGAGTLERLIERPHRCFVVARLAMDKVLRFQPLEPWRLSSRLWARLKVEPVGALGARAIALYGNFRRMAEAGVGLRYQMRATADGLRFYGALPRLVYAPDLSKVSLPVVADEGTLGGGGPPPVEAPADVKLVPVLYNSRVSTDGLTMSYGRGGPYSWARTDVARRRGKWYAEATLRTRPGQKAPDVGTTVGVARAPASDWDFVNGIARIEAFNAFSRERPHDGDVVGIAFNTELQRAYFYFDGHWVNGRPDDPKAGTWIEHSNAYVLYAASAAPPRRHLGSNSWTFNFGASAFAHPMPPGYLSWDGHRGPR